MELIPITGIPEITPGVDLAEILLSTDTIISGDVVVVTQKVVSKAENRLVPIDPDIDGSHRSLISGESRRILRRRGELVIAETHHGFVCANAGIDLSNVEPGYAALLPVDSDRSARRIRDVFVHRAGIDIGVVISDTFGRPWRRGVTDVAIGSAGLRTILDLRGTQDALGRELAVTEVAIVDELAAAAELVMGKSSGVPAAIVRGVRSDWFGEGSVVTDLVRSPSEVLFR